MLIQVRSLLERPERAEPRICDKFQKTALMYACEKNTEASVAIISEILSKFECFCIKRKIK
jgi:hypothetical protein